MAAAQVFIALWAASLAVAAPQGLDEGSGQETSINQDEVVSQVVAALGPSINQDEVVSQVVAALGPSITQAVEEALASLNQATSVASAQAAANAAAERAAFEADLARDSIIAAPTARPVYNFEYKVADDTAQTYISQNEERDGDNLSGSYSYVDPNGGLVTVNYQAGPMGYSETREVQDGFVKITAKPAQSKVDADAVILARAQAGRQEAARLEASRLEAVRVESARLEAARLEATRLESVSVDQSSLIAQVLAALQPLISQTVQEVVSSSSTSSSSSSTSLSSSSTAGSSVATGDVASTFGTDSLSVSVETPEFQFAF